MRSPKSPLGPVRTAARRVTALAMLVLVDCWLSSVTGWSLLATSALAERPEILVIGDSTAFGTALGNRQSKYQPGAVLEQLLKKTDPPTSFWRRARVTNLAVGASTTLDWLETPPPDCSTFFGAYQVAQRACRDQISWADAVLRIRPSADLIILQLGLNDYLITSDPVETVDRIERIRAKFVMSVLVFPPIGPTPWAASVRAELEARGYDIPANYPSTLPTYDGLHPTDGGYAAMAGLWLDRVLAQH